MFQAKIIGRVAAGTDGYHRTISDDNLEAGQELARIASRNTVGIVISANFSPLCSTARLSQCRAGNLVARDG